jgi:parallel beta-helix repeat protein
MRQLCLYVILGFAVVGVASAATYTVSPGEEIQPAVDRAQPGDTVRVLPGQYKQTVYIDKDNIRLSGVVQDDKWPVIDGEGVRHDGVIVASHGVTVEGLHIKRFRGNGIMMQGGNNYTIAHNWVEGPSFYGIFPQYGKNGLVTHNVVSGVADAAIYMGMGQNSEVLYNDVSDSMTGVEVENGLDMLVEGNYSHGNSAGILISLVKGLPIKSGQHTYVRNNYLVSNNKPPPADSPLLSGFPEGLGIVIDGTDSSFVEGNVFRDNNSGGVIVLDVANGFPDPKADPYVNGHQILTNVFVDNGQKPQGMVLHLMTQLNRTAGADLLVVGRGRDNCVLGKESISTLGAESWKECPAGTTTATMKTVRLAAPVPTQRFTLEQQGRLTYLAVCTGCHSFNNRMVGPPMVAARALYIGKPQALADWMAHPVKRRSDYPEMPPQGYIPADVRLEVAKYILGNPDQ